MRVALGRTRPRQGEVSDELAESPQQRKVERRPHRLGPELLRERRVGRELPAVALELLGEKALEPAALVTAGLVVDHPARAALVHEAAIDHDAPESPGREPGEGQLARRLTMSAAEQPPSALVGDRASERRQDLPGRIFLLPLGHARALELPRDRLAGALESLWGGERGGVREAREEGVRGGRSEEHTSEVQSL